MRTLDRIVKFDNRSRAFAAVEETGKLHSQHWHLEEVLDQGSEGACVGFSLTHNLLAHQFEPGRSPTSIAMRIYRLAKKVDEWAGESYSGTSVLAGCKVLKRKNVIRSYKWAFGLDDVLQVLALHGPLVLGIPWYESMYEPVDDMVSVGGNKVGGHAIFANGIDVENKTVTLHNSWGPDWGDRGEAEISWDDLGKLLSDEGEAVRLLMGTNRKEAVLDE